MADDSGKGQAKRHTAGISLDPASVLTLTYDHATHQVAISGDAIPLSLGQMIVDEARRLLEEKRRLVTAQQIAATVRQQAADQALLDRVNRGR